MDALIFIDTNILLDFYRIRKSEVSMSYLKLIDDHRDVMITGSQVEMEYQKNRQHVILDSLGKFKNPDWNNLSVPALFSESEEAKLIDNCRGKISKQQSILNGKIHNLLKSPSEHDPVFKTLKSLFRSNLKFNLSIEHSDYEEVKRLALERFMLGYPPRKKGDTSIGDAINWEWIIKCASGSGKSIIVVTRDGDYGVNVKNDSFLNDWLSREFSDRVSNEQEVILTARLSEAFKSINLPVSKDMIEEESRIIKSYEEVVPPEESDNVTGKIFEILKSYKQ